MVEIFEKYDVSTNKELMKGITETLLNIPWLENVGTVSENTELKLAEVISEITKNKYGVKWLEKEKLVNQIENVNFEDSEVWENLKHLPTQYKDELEKIELLETWDILLNEVPEHVFHIVFEKSYELFNDEKSVKFLINNVFYMCVLITLARLTGDDSIAEKLIELVKTGNVVVGFEGDKIILL